MQQAVNGDGKPLSNRRRCCARGLNTRLSGDEGPSVRKLLDPAFRRPVVMGAALFEADQGGTLAALRVLQRGDILE